VKKIVDCECEHKENKNRFQKKKQKNMCSVKTEALVFLKSFFEKVLTCGALKI